MKESALYQPVKSYFESLGFLVRAEVKDCDVVAVSNDQLVIVELKLNFCLQLLYQGLKRQNITQFVYLCISRPKRSTGTAYKNMLDITKRLGLGLITVATTSPTNAVDVLLHPLGKKKPLNKKKGQIIRETAERSGDYNIGGSKGKINTAYREKSVQIACLLEKTEPMRPRDLIREHGCSPDTGNILYQNYYGWFDRVEKGVYCLSQKGRQALDDPGFSQLTNHYRKEAKVYDKKDNTSEE